MSDAQILAMVDAGYDYVIYQVNWSHKKWGATGNGVFRGYTARNHMSSPYASKLKFSILWDDVNSKLENTCVGCEAYNYWMELGWDGATVRNDYSALFTAWFRDFAPNPNFFRRNGRPVVFFFNPERLKTPRAVLGGSTPTAPEIITLLRSVAAQYGFSGASTPFIVGQNVPDLYVDSLYSWGFNAHSGYVYQNPDSIPGTYHPTGQNYSTARQVYVSKWQAMLQKSSPYLEYWVPNAAGRDSRPWEGAYYWTATATNFEDLVQASMSVSSQNWYVTGRNLVTCCWNEWGEGSYVEPSTMDYGYTYRGSALSDANRRTSLAQPAGSNRAPSGWFDMISADGYAAGWALDPDTPNQPLIVHFYKNGYYPTGQFIGGSLTDQVRGDINSSYGVEGTHGFWFRIPASACNSYIYVHLIDTSGNDENPHLGGGPRYFAC